MKKQFTLSYAQIERRHNTQSRWLIVIGAVLVALALSGIIISLAGARREYSARQSLIAGTSERYVAALSSKDKLASAGGDIRAFMRSTLDDARAFKLSTYDNQRRVLAEQDKLARADAPDDAGIILYENENSRMKSLLKQMRTLNGQALTLAGELDALYGAQMAQDFKADALAQLDEVNRLTALYDDAVANRKALKSAQTAANKPLRAALKEDSGATDEEISNAQAAYDEATRALDIAEAAKDAAYANQQAAISAMNQIYMRAEALLPSMSGWQKIALALSSPIMWAALLILGAEMCAIGLVCLKSPKRIPMSVLADVLIYDFFVVLGAVMLAPLMYVAVGSFSSTGLAQFRFGKLDFNAYRMIAFSARTMRSVGNSFLITIVGTLMNIVLTSITAYALSKRDLPGRGWMLKLVIVFMLFHAGLIPDYMLIANRLQLTNTYWAIWLPVLISSSNLIIMKNFFQQLPESIEESARIDGCNEIQSFIYIVLPMSMASIATFSLFYAVGHWNNYQRAMIYVTDPNKYPITVLLRQVVILSQGSLADDVLPEVAVWAPTNSVKYATIMIGTIPIICVYPFLQKHFTKGVLLGSVKG